MTIKPLIVLLTALSISACHPTHSSDENDHEADNNDSDIISPASDLTPNATLNLANSHSTPNNLNSSTTQSVHPQSNAIYAYDYTALSTPAGDIMAGDLASIDSLKSKLPDDVTIKRGINHYEDEGEQWEEPKLIVSTDSEVLFDLPYSDWDGADIIERVVIHSPDIKNADNIGVDTSVSEFIRTYPFAKLYYTHVSGNIWLENGVGSVEFILKPSDAIMSSIDIDSDWMELDPAILPATQKIDSIELSASYSSKSQYFGEWEDPDSDIVLKIFEQDDKIKYVLSDGTENSNSINTFRGDFIPIYDDLYSDPTNDDHLIQMYFHYNDSDKDRLILTPSPDIDSLIFDLTRVSTQSQALNQSNPINGTSCSNNQVDNTTDDPQTIADIQSTYTSINELLSSNTGYHVETDNTPHADSRIKAVKTLTYYINNDGDSNLQRMIKQDHTRYFKMGEKRIQSYFFEGDLRFTLETDIAYNVPKDREAFDESASTTKENRYYFKCGYMIRWIDENNQDVDPKSQKFNMMARDFLM